MKTNEELVVDYQAGSKLALSQLCEQNKGLVARIARGLTGETEDLFQSGMIGLVEAANRFDIERGFKFSPYASNWIFAQCVACSKESNGIVNVNGREGRKVLNLIGRVKKSLSEELGRDATVSEIANEMQVDESIVSSIVGISGKSLDAQIKNEDSSSLSEIIPDTSESIEEISESLSIQNVVRAFADTLSNEFEKFVFLNVMAGEMTNQEAGDARDVSRQRINQIVVKLRPKFEKYAIKHELNY